MRVPIERKTKNNQPMPTHPLQGEVRHQVAEPPDLEENFQGRYEITVSESSIGAETRKEPRKSRAMSKLKELRGLKEAELV